MKQDLNGVRTPEDVVRRYEFENIKVLMDDVDGITTEVKKKVGEDEIISKINQSAEQISIQADKIKLEGYTTINNGFSIDTDGNMACKNAAINGGQLTLNSTEENPEITITNIPLIDEGYTDGREQIQHKLTGDGFLIRDTGDFDGETYAVLRTYGSHFYDVPVSAQLLLGSELNNQTITLDGWSGTIGTNGLYVGTQSGDTDPGFIYMMNEDDTPIMLDADDGSIECVSLTQTSLEEKKKNIEKLDNALDIVKDTDIYKYHFKRQTDDEKKHIGFIIGKNYNYREELTDNENKGVDIYSMVSVLWKAVQEQQKEIEKLKEGKNDSY